MTTELEHKKEELKEIRKKIQELQIKGKAIASYIRLKEWRKEKESET